MQSWSWTGLVAACALIISVVEASAYDVTIRRNIEYANHDGVKLHGELYHPWNRERDRLPVVPVLIAVHGGGWQSGTPATYKHWGTYLAETGLAVFAIEYRLASQKLYPAAVYDVRAAVQYVRAHAAQLGIDPDRIALMGDGAGAHLAALVTLANAEPAFSTAYKNDANAATPANVKAAVLFYGVYDLAAQWAHDQTARPLDQVTGKFLGGPPAANRQLYAEASPKTYATVERNKPAVLLIYGASDEVVDAGQQSQAFQAALREAQFVAPKIEIPSVGHGWVSDPFTDPQSPNAYVGSRLLRFLEKALIGGPASPPS
jgi:acetyl esterase/lipase